MGSGGGASERDALRDEVLRVHARYAHEVVEQLGFCPWAAHARANGRVQTRVIFGHDGALPRTLHAVECLERDENADIGLLVFPECVLPRVDFQHFAARVRDAVEARSGRGQSVFAVADFHPCAELDLSSAERLVAFIRRSPDPTLQLLRRSVLEAIRRGEQPGTRFVDPALFSETGPVQAPSAPALHERVARANLDTVRRLGVEHVAAVLDDVIADRDRSYARLGVSQPAWSAAARIGGIPTPQGGV